MTSVLDDYFVDPKVSLLDKTRMQAQILVPVLRTLRTELGKDKADALVKQALRDWSKQLFAAIGRIHAEGVPVIENDDANRAARTVADLVLDAADRSRKR